LQIVRRPFEHALEGGPVAVHQGQEQAIALALRMADGILEEIHYAAIAGDEGLLVRLPVHRRSGPWVPQKGKTDPI
jgi:hypothetical protein